MPEGHVFVCYSRKDGDFAKALTSNLRERGLAAWLDQLNLVASDNWELRIEEALRTCHALLIVLSPDSVASSEVRAELRTALDLNKTIIPVLHRQCDLPPRLKLIQHIDFLGKSAHWDAGLRAILLALRQQPLAPERETGRKIVRRAIYPAGFAAVAVLALLAYVSWTRQGTQPSPPKAGPTVEEQKIPPGPENITATKKPVTPLRRAEVATNNPGPHDVVHGPPALISSGIPLAEAGRCQEAIQLLQREARVTPDNPQTHFHLGACLYRTGQYSDAIQSLNVAVQQNDHNPDYFRYRGLAKWKNANHAGAIQDLTTAIELAPKEAALFCDRGQIYLATQDYQKAVDNFRKATQLAPDDKTGWKALGEALIKNGDRELGNEALRTAGELP